MITRIIVALVFFHLAGCSSLGSDAIALAKNNKNTENFYGSDLKLVANLDELKYIINNLSSYSADCTKNKFPGAFDEKNCSSFFSLKIINAAYTGDTLSIKQYRNVIFNHPVYWLGCGSTIPSLINFTDPSGQTLYIENQYDEIFMQKFSKFFEYSTWLINQKSTDELQYASIIINGLEISEIDFNRLAVCSIISGLNKPQTTNDELFGAKIWQERFKKLYGKSPTEIENFVSKIYLPLKRSLDKIEKKSGLSNPDSIAQKLTLYNNAKKYLIGTDLLAKEDLVDFLDIKIALENNFF